MQGRMRHARGIQGGRFLVPASLTRGRHRRAGSRRSRYDVNEEAIIEWQRWRKRMIRGDDPPDGAIAYDGPTEYWTGQTRPSRLLYFTKDALFRWWFLLWG